jgi:hypothetical protein
MIGRPPTKSTIDSRGCWRDAVGNDASRRVAMNCAEPVSSFAHTRFIQGGLRYSARLGFFAVLHKEIDVAATSRSRHESDPPPFSVLTGSGLLGSAPARAA